MKWLLLRKAQLQKDIYGCSNTFTYAMNIANGKYIRVSHSHIAWTRGETQRLFMSHHGSPMQRFNHLVFIAIVARMIHKRIKGNIRYFGHIFEIAARAHLISMPYKKTHKLLWFEVSTFVCLLPFLLFFVFFCWTFSLFASSVQCILSKFSVFELCMRNMSIFCMNFVYIHSKNDGRCHKITFSSGIITVESTKWVENTRNYHCKWRKYSFALHNVALNRCSLNVISKQANGYNCRRITGWNNFRLVRSNVCFQVINRTIWEYCLVRKINRKTKNLDLFWSIEWTWI